MELHTVQRSFLDILACPLCRTDRPFDLVIVAEESGDVITGVLSCQVCAAEFQIANGIPRFVSTAEDYCHNFGFQWQNWKDIQIDRLSGHCLSETRFFNDSRWEPGWLRDKLVLDAGCGAGRFADVAALHGARVIACDISAAVDACRDVLLTYGERVECVQASLYDMPFRDGVFDAVFCMGVIQHTPEPEKVIAGLPTYVRPGGRVAYNFYEEGFWRRLQVIKYGLRLITPHLPIGVNLALSKALVVIFFNFTRALSGIRRVRVLNHFVPIAAVHDPELTRDQQFTWTLLDTFDWYSPRHEKRQRHEQVKRILKNIGLEDVESQPGLAWANVPAPPRASG